METKQCSTCKAVKSIECFYKHKQTKDGIRGQCISCVAKYNKANGSKNAKKYYISNIEIIKQKAKLNAEANLIRLKNWRRRNPEKVRMQKRRAYNSTITIESRFARYRDVQKKSFKKRKDNLTESYVKQCIKQQDKILFSEIPEELVELKREKIRLHRIIKELKNVKSTSDE